MTVTEFTPFASSLGGALIGVAAVMLMALNGRIAGISGIVGRLLPPYAGADPVGAACIVLGRPSWSRKYTHFRTDRLHIASPNPLCLNVDGDVAGPAKDLSIQVLPGAVQMVYG